MVASTLTASRVVADDARHVPMRIESFGSPSGGMASATEMVSVRARAIQHGATTEIPAEVGAELLAVAKNNLGMAGVTVLEQDTQADNHSVVQACEPSRQLGIGPRRVGKGCKRRHRLVRMVKRRGSVVIGGRRSMRMSGHILRRHRQLHTAAFRADGEDGLVRVHCGRQGLHGARRLAESWANLSSTWRGSGGG